MWLLVALIAVPLIEIALFIQVGGAIGLWPTLVYVLLTGLLGTWLLRMQGALALSRLRRSLSEFDDPSEPLAHGAMILFAGALLLTPGFFTDSIGFALLVPPVRRWVFGSIRKRMTLQHVEVGRRPAGDPRYSPDPDIIEGEFHEVGPAKRPTHGASGWTRH
ncbi:MAG: exlusion protein FxsA [Rhodobacteraceae bacterium CG17_big_fil_post_rev_8_21_14_2_50_63_15]|nr:FxsA family protein [Roseovarius sp.]PIV78381.1 MAG: exlusion protein FxsA [Rhodobacteraceae bacterium CG17_big_fil_post_rev_8_21_14_2_50_63_15]